MRKPVTRTTQATKQTSLVFQQEPSIRTPTAGQSHVMPQPNTAVSINAAVGGHPMSLRQRTRPRHSHPRSFLLHCLSRVAADPVESSGAFDMTALPVCAHTRRRTSCERLCRQRRRGLWVQGWQTALRFRLRGLAKSAETWRVGQDSPLRLEQPRLS